MPAVIARERQALAGIASPEEMADVERRAAALAELAKRAGLAVPIQNEATFYRADALRLLALLADEHEKAKGGRGKTAPDPGTVWGRGHPKHQRLSEGRSLAKTDALKEAEAEAAQNPEKPVSMDAILKRAKRREREQKLRGERQRQEETARAAIAASSEKPYALFEDDVKTWRPKGVAAVITDPPYVGDAIPLYEALRTFAVDVLSEGGPLVVMTWQAILPGVFDALRHPDLAYRWTICWRFANAENTADQARRVFDCWKPVLVYHKGDMPADAAMIRDEVANAAPDKEHHEWGQSVAGFERLVRSFTRAGEIVCDPFLGGGTTAVAALALHRRFVGCDVSAEAVATAEARLAA